VNLGGRYAAVCGSARRRPPPIWVLGLPVKREWTIEVPAPVEKQPFPAPEPDPEPEPERSPEEVPA